MSNMQQTPKEYAIKLIEKYCMIFNSIKIAKQCAIIAVDEVIKEYNNATVVTAFYRYGFNSDMLKARLDYLYEVKQELEKI